MHAPLLCSQSQFPILEFLYPTLQQKMENVNFFSFFLACVSQLNQQIMRRNDKPLPFDGSQQLEQLSPLSAISASSWAYYIEPQNNVRGKKSVMTWEGMLPGTEVTDQQPL